MYFKADRTQKVFTLGLRERADRGAWAGRASAPWLSALAVGRRLASEMVLGRRLEETYGDRGPTAGRRDPKADRAAAGCGPTSEAD